MNTKKASVAIAMGLLSAVSLSTVGTAPAQAATPSAVSATYNIQFGTDATATTFSFDATGAPSGSTMKVTFIKNGQEQTAGSTALSFYSGEQPGWTSATAKVYNRYGRLISTSSTLTPPSASVSNYSVTASNVTSKSFTFNVAGNLTKSTVPWMEVKYTQNGQEKSIITGLQYDKTTWGLDWVDGWTKAQAFVYNENGVLAATSAVITPPASTNPTTPTPPVPTSKLRTAKAGAMLQNQNPNYIGDAGKADVLILQQNEYAKIPAIKAANPNAKVYFYSNASAYSKIATDPAYQPNVVTLTQAKAHPEWNLKSSNGGLYTWGNYSYLQPADLGSPTYQQAAISNLKAEITAHGWDGVMLDDVNVDDTGHGHSVTDNPANLTGGNRVAATASFLKAVGPAIKGMGKDVAINFQQTWPQTLAAVDDYVPHVTHVVVEHATQTGGDESLQNVKPDNYFATSYHNGWNWLQDEMKDIQSTYGKAILPLDYMSTQDVRAQRYSRASFLMTWDGKSDSASLFHPAEQDKSFYMPEAFTDLGAPLGSVTEPVAGVKKRVFAKGTLYLNTNTSATTVQTGSGPVTLGSLQAYLGS